MLLLSSADFFQKIISEALSECQNEWIQQDQHFVGPDLGPNCLQRLQGSHMLEKYLIIQDCLEKSLKIRFALKSTVLHHVSIDSKST